MVRKFVIAALFGLWASLALAADPPNEIVQSFMVDVTVAEQGFTMQSKVGTLVRQATCNAWLVENDSTTQTVYIKTRRLITALPVAVATDAELHQIRLKPGQAKRLDDFINMYVSIIGTGDAAVRFEQTCLPPGS